MYMCINYVYVYVSYHLRLLGPRERARGAVSLIMSLCNDNMFARAGGPGAGVGPPTIQKVTHTLVVRVAEEEAWHNKFEEEQAELQAAWARQKLCLIELGMSGSDLASGTGYCY